MSLRCFLFSSDEETVASLRQILSGLGVEGEVCSNAVTAVERITNQPFQIVIIDWDQQPEAGLLLTTARERKAAERPITLAIVSDDASAPRALHAGANSLLRKPIVANQARETLTTARDLLRAKQGSAANAAAAAAASSPASSSVLPSALDPGKVATLRAGEFLQTASLTPGEHFETEAAVPQSPEESASEPVDPLKELEPMAASVSQSQEKDTPAAPTAPVGSRGLEWYLKTRVVAQPSANATAAPAPARGNPELLGYEQASSYSAPPPPVAPPSFEAITLKPPPKLDRPSVREQKKEAELFAYIQGDEDRSSEEASSSGFRLGKRAIIGALVLAACAIIAAPQAPWHPKLQRLWGSGKQSIHAWLNPQPVTPPPAPVTHETFTRAGDEYKLPVADPIPDATTDPSQIKVLPVIDPTLRKPNNDGTSPDPTALAPDGSTPPADIPAQTPAGQSPENQPSPGNSDPFRPPLGERAAPTPSQPVTVIESPVAAHPDSTTAVSPSPFTAPPPRPHVVSTPGKIPTSLQSQLAPKNPTVGGNKPLESALPSIEPVQVPEITERLLIVEDPSPVYPANAKGQQGTVVLQVLIARDGTVQDAKFIQGSLVFARNAIDTARQWKFKPYQMNGHPVSVQTLLTVKFKPAQ